VLNGTYAFLPRLIAQPERSHIVNTSSMSGVGRADLRLTNAPYVTAKFAVAGLTEVMRPALAEHGIGVSVLCPGFTAGARPGRPHVAAAEAAPPGGGRPRTEGLSRCPTRASPLAR
jgi:NAD(P)-dependent dehydrogenase (short-subunit alcohol dehydrogenase family)